MTSIDSTSKVQVDLNMAALTGNVSHMLNAINYLMESGKESIGKISIQGEAEADDATLAQKFKDLPKLDLIQELADLQTLFPPNFKFEPKNTLAKVLEVKKHSDHRKSVSTGEYLTNRYSDDFNSVISIQKDGKSFRHYDRDR